MWFRSKCAHSSLKTYDLVTIGPYANQISKIINHSHSQSQLTRLAIETNQHVTEPSLHLTNQPFINLTRKLQHFSDVESGVNIKKLNHLKNQLTLENDVRYAYKQLVFSGSEMEWLDLGYWSKFGIDSLDMLTFSDYGFHNIKELYNRNFGTIVFLLPDRKHFGYNNYFMTNLKSYIETHSVHREYPLNIKVLNLGQELIPNSKSKNAKFQAELVKNNIEVHHNFDLIKINTQKKIIKAANREIKYDGLFYYIPKKIPKILSQAQINPFYINQSTFQHSLHHNVHIIDHGLSFEMKKNAIETIAQNIIFKHEKTKKTAHQIRNVSEELRRGKIANAIHQYKKHHEINNFFNGNFYLRFVRSFQTQEYDEKLCPIKWSSI